MNSSFQRRKSSVILSNGRIVDSKDPAVALDQKYRWIVMFWLSLKTNWMYVVSFLAVITVSVCMNWHDGGYFGHQKNDIPVQRWIPNAIVPELYNQKLFVRTILSQAGTNSIWNSITRFMNRDFDYNRFVQIDAGLDIILSFSLFLLSFPPFLY